MKKHYSQTQNYLFLLLFVGITSCNGQYKTEKQVATNAIESAKISKPKGIYKEAAIGTGVQDKAGNIWFGSNGEGVYRYDGKSFTHFTTKDGLDNNIVYSILADKAGNIWVGTKTGLNRYDASRKTFTLMPIIVNRGNNTSILNGVWCMMQDKKSIIWLGTDEGVYCYKPSTLLGSGSIYFTRFLDDSNVFNRDTLQLKAIFSIFEDKAGEIWFGACADEGISRFDGKTLTNIVPYNAVRRVNNIIEDNSGNLLFATSFNGICRYEPSALLTSTPLSASKADGKMFAKNIFMRKKGYQSGVLKDKAGNIWFDENERVGYFDGKALKNISEKDGLPTNNMYPILEDKSGNIWFSSVGMGLYRYDPSDKSFTKFLE